VCFAFQLPDLLAYLTFRMKLTHSGNRSPKSDGNECAETPAYGRYLTSALARCSQSLAFLARKTLPGCSCAPQEMTKRRSARTGDGLIVRRCESAPGDNTIEPANSSGYFTAISRPIWAPWEKPNVMTLPCSIVTRSLTSANAARTRLASFSISSAQTKLCGP